MNIELIEKIQKNILKDIFLIGPNEWIEPQYEIAEGEQLLGPMSHLAVCVYTALAKKIKAAQALIEEIHLLFHQPPDPAHPEPVDISEPFAEDIERLKQLIFEIVLFEQLIIEIIQEDFKVDCEVDVRQGYRAVNCEKRRALPPLLAIMAF